MDYSSRNTIVVFFSGTTRNCVTVPIEADGVLEGNEDFSISLSGLNPGVIFNVSMATVTISDSDS